MRRFVFIAMTALALASCQESLEDRCAREAKEFTQKKCPAYISDNTTVDSMTFDRSTHTIHYHYTISGKGDDPVLLKNLNPRKILVNEIRNSTTNQTFKEAGYNFAYTYYSASRKGMKLFDVIIKEKDYK